MLILVKLKYSKVSLSSNRNTAFTKLRCKVFNSYNKNYCKERKCSASRTYVNVEGRKLRLSLKQYLINLIRILMLKLAQSFAQSNCTVFCTNCKHSGRNNF